MFVTVELLMELGERGKGEEKDKSIGNIANHQM
jgi:hypothetical protein